KCRKQGGYRPRLLKEGEFGPGRLLAIIHDWLELDRGCQTINRLNDLLQDCQIGCHQVGDVRVLHLDRHLSPVVQSSSMYLRDRSGGDWFMLDLREHF